MSERFDNRQKGIQKTIYLDKEAFVIMDGLMTEEKRSLSDIVNKILRKALIGSKIGNTLDEIIN